MDTYAFQLEKLSNECSCPPPLNTPIHPRSETLSRLKKSLTLNFKGKLKFIINQLKYLTFHLKNQHLLVLDYANNLYTIDSITGTLISKQQISVPNDNFLITRDLKWIINYEAPALTVRSFTTQEIYISTEIDSQSFLKVSPNCTYLVLYEKKLFILDLLSTKISEYEGNSSGITDLKFSDNEEWIIFSTKITTLESLKIKNNEKVIICDDIKFICLAISDNELCAACSEDNTIYVYSLKSFQLVYLFQTDCSPKKIFISIFGCVACVSNSKFQYFSLLNCQKISEQTFKFQIYYAISDLSLNYFLFYTSNGALVRYKPDNNVSKAMFQLQSKKIIFMAQTNDNQYLIMANLNNLLCIVHKPSETLLKRFSDCVPSVNSIQISNFLLIYATIWHKIVIFCIQTQKIVNVLTSPNIRFGNTLLYTPSMVFAAGEKNGLVLWDLRLETCNRINCNGTINDIITTQHQEFAICASINGLTIFDLEDYSIIFLYPGQGCMTSVAIVDSNRRYLVFQSWNSEMNNWNRVKDCIAKVNVFDIKNKHLEVTLPSLIEFSFALSADSNYLCYMSSENKIQCWKMQSQKSLNMNTFNISVSYSDKKSLIVATEIGVLAFDYSFIEQWNIRSTLEKIVLISITPDGKFIILIGLNSIVEVWNITLHNKTLKRNLEHIGYASEISCNNENFFLIFTEGIIKYYSLLRGDIVCLFEIPEGHFTSILITPSYSELIISCQFHGILISNLFEAPVRLNAGVMRNISCMSISETLLAMGSDNGYIFYWNYKQKQDYSFWSSRGNISDISVCEDLSLILYLNMGMFKLWDTASHTHRICIDASIAVWVKAENKIFIMYRGAEKNFKSLEITDIELSGKTKKSMVLMMNKSKIRIK